MNTAEYIIKKMEELGINEIFGVPGDYNFSILEAIENNSGTDWVGCTNELNAGYAADGYARIRGYGALVTTYGVGELSAINAIAGCFAENIPVVCLVGLPSTDFINNKKLIHHNFQNINYQAFMNAFQSLTSTTAFLSKDNAKLEIDRVFKSLVREKQPIYIAIPDDIAKMEISERYSSPDWICDKNVLNEAAKKIADKINASEKPVIIGDVLIKRFDAKLEYKEFVIKSGIPVSNLMMGMNLVEMDYPKYIGGYYGDLKNPIAQKYIEETDCLIAVGIIYSDINSFGFSFPFDINNQIAIYGNYAYIEGQRYDNIKMAELLETVTGLIETKTIDTNKPNIGYKHINTDSEDLTSDYIYSRIQEFIKDNDIVFTETGTVPFGVIQMKAPANAEFQFQTLWGSIGWATPAVLGASLAKPQTRTILITGEGAHQISLMEIGTMLKRGLKPIIIVINNNGYTIERLLSKNTNDKFNDIVQMNYSKFARVFEGDVWSTKATTKDDFDKALKVTQIMNKMCYIEACIKELDVPSLVKDFVCKNKGMENCDTENSAQTENKYIEELIYNSPESGLQYETIVHKGFSNDNNIEQVGGN